MSFEDNLRRALDPTQQLPLQLHLGKYAYSWTSGKLEKKGEQAGFRRLTEDELRQLIRRLQAAPQHLVMFLNLGFHEMGEGIIREMVSAIAALKALQVLILECTPTSQSVNPPTPSPHSLPKTAIAFSHRVCMLYNALRGVRFHTLQLTKSATPDALRLRGLCRTSRRFNN
jgi:hypothetical protein